MKLWTTAIAAIFALLTLLPASAGAEPIVWQPPAIQQAAYYPVYYPYGRPRACRNWWFRIHHRRLCF
jgi:hypothetical protein